IKHKAFRPNSFVLNIESFFGDANMFDQRRIVFGENEITFEKLKEFITDADAATGHQPLIKDLDPAFKEKWPKFYNLLKSSQVSGRVEKWLSPLMGG
ncbi:hypothetical protein, partial [Klebsiella pneumoniae]|uniref:hypothetical protein n=1 Tax=Klebsiella pneumoniae TaxID=573 RepID=UPI002730A988